MLVAVKSAPVGGWPVKTTDDEELPDEQASTQIRAHSNIDAFIFTVVILKRKSRKVRYKMA